MIPLNDTDPGRQAARSWSERLGNLAAASSSSRPDGAFNQPDAPPPAIPPRLASVLNHLRRRAQAREHAAEKLRLNEFHMAP
jgi:hypothetical protein